MEVDSPPEAPQLSVGARVWLVRVRPEEGAPLSACCYAASGLLALWHDAACADVILDDGSEAHAVPAQLLAAAPAAGCGSYDEHASRGRARWREGAAAAAAAEFAAALAALPASGAPPPGAPPPPRVGAAALVRHDAAGGVYRCATVCCVDERARTADVMFDGDDAAAAAGAEDEAADVSWGGADDTALLCPLSEDDAAPCDDVAQAAVRAWTNLARALLRCGCCVAARAAAATALAWRPAHAPALLVRGLARAQPPERDLAAAAADLRATAALRPNAAEPREALRDVARLRAQLVASDRRLALAVAGLAREAAAA